MNARERMVLLTFLGMFAVLAIACSSEAESDPISPAAAASIDTAQEHAYFTEVMAARFIY